jgi:hypothetical protein
MENGNATSERSEEGTKAAEIVSETEILEELLEQDDGENGPEEALFAICMSAMQDADFGSTTVEQILRSLGLGEYWASAQELLSDSHPEELDNDPEPGDED